VYGYIQEVDALHAGLKGGFCFDTQLSKEHRKYKWHSYLEERCCRYDTENESHAQKSRPSHNIAALVLTMSTVPNVNPFYIEPTSEWEGDFDWDSDNEEERLLDNHRQQHHHYDHPRSHTIRRGTPPRSSFWICCLVAFVILFVLLSLLGQSTELPKSHSKQIQHVIVLGERNSGVYWLKNTLQSCYSSNLSISTHWTRPAFWFQNASNAFPQNTLLIIMVRHPFQWTQAMRLHPLYMPHHMNLTLQNFTTQPWTMSRPINDTKYACQLGFSYNQVMPCRALSTDNQNPIYELNNNGTAFASILELRAAKIRHWMQEIPALSNIRPFIIHYEEASLHGLDMILNQRHVCSVTSKPTVPLSKEQRQWLVNRIDWQAEALIGYHRD